MALAFGRPQNPLPANQGYSKSQSVALPNAPGDSISSLRWSNDGVLLACTSWDKSVRIWSVSAGFGGNINAAGKAMYQLDAPVLSSCFAPNNQHFFAGGCDKMVKMFDLNQGGSQGQQVARHDQPISQLAWNPTQNVLVTGSWDGWLKMWDGKQAQPIWQQNIQAKVFTMDVKDSLMAVADSKRNIYLWNLQQIQMPNAMMQLPSPLKMQLRCLNLFPDTVNMPGLAIGSVGGRCAIMYAREEHRKHNFSYRCHRRETNAGQNIYPVNALDFHLKLGTFATCGSDGTIVIWDKDARCKLKSFENMGMSVSSLKFNPANNILAYAISYDWHKGADQSEISKNINQVLVHQVKEEDIRPKPKVASGTRR